MSTSTWFWTATGSGAACVVLAVVVVVAGWRRRLSEVAFLATGLFVVSVFATAHGLSGTSLLASGPSRWAAAVALPLGIAATAPLLAPRSVWARRCSVRWRVWVVAWLVSTLLLALVAVVNDQHPPTAVAVGALIVGAAGAVELARRQVWLFQVSGRGSALAVAGAVVTIAIAAIVAVLVDAGSGPAWAVLGVESLGVFTAGLAILIGYRTKVAVTDILAPLVAFEPLAALEVGMAPEVHAFVAALERIDPITRDHVVRTSALAMRVATRAGLGPAVVRDVTIGALLHDIGKLVMPSEILHKPGALTDEEFATVRTHPEQGERLLDAAPSLRGAAPYVRGHHERVDGAGYPDGLEGEEVPFEVSLVSVVDAWDAMTNTRQYREGMSVERAAAILRDGAGTQWRDDVVALLLAELRARGSTDLTHLDKIGARSDSSLAAVCADALPQSLLGSWRVGGQAASP